MIETIQKKKPNQNMLRLLVNCTTVCHKLNRTDEIRSQTRKMGVKLKEKTLMRKWKSCGRDPGDVEAT